MVVVVDDDATGLRRFDDLVDVDDTPHAASITAATATAMRLKVRCPETHPGALPAPGLITSRQGRAPDAVLQGCPITGALVGPLRRCAWACVVRPRPERSNLETRTCGAPRSRVVRDRAPAPDTATIRRPAWFVARNGRRLVYPGRPRGLSPKRRDAEEGFALPTATVPTHRRARLAARLMVRPADGNGPPSPCPAPSTGGSPPQPQSDAAGRLVPPQQPRAAPQCRGPAYLFICTRKTAP